MISSIRVVLERWVYTDDMHEIRIRVDYGNDRYAEVNRILKVDDFTTNFDYMFDAIKRMLKDGIQEEMKKDA